MGLKKYCLAAIIIAGILVVSVSSAQQGGIFFRDDFSSLENWKPLTFPKIKRSTEYSIVFEEDGSHLKAESNASASGIVFKKEFHVFDYPKIRWRWKISNVLKKGNVEIKAGDDYPIRIYIIFKYEPEEASFGKRVKYGVAKTIYGKYPPDSSLNYIWANREHKEAVVVSPYANESMMVILQSGTKHAGEWIEEEVNIIEDYRRAFGSDPPHVASLAIMNDSDDTGESAVSYMDYIEIYR